MTHKEFLLAHYEEYPFHHHPYWVAVVDGRLSYDQIIQAEVQHYIRSAKGRELRKEALREAQQGWPELFEALLETYLEECTDDKTGPSHLDLVKRLVMTGGVTEEQLRDTVPTPGNIAAMALYADIGRRGPAFHMIGAGVVEYYYAQLCPSIFEAYTTHFGMSDIQAETYKIHGELDLTHAQRAFSVAEKAIEIFGEKSVSLAVRDALVATSLHYDGMLQAATGSKAYWEGGRND